MIFPFPHQYAFYAARLYPPVQVITNQYKSMPFYNMANWHCDASDICHYSNSTLKTEPVFISVSWITIFPTSFWPTQDCHIISLKMGSLISLSHTRSTVSAQLPCPGYQSNGGGDCTGVNNEAINPPSFKSSQGQGIYLPHLSCHPHLQIIGINSWNSFWMPYTSPAE